MSKRYIFFFFPFLFLCHSHAQTMTQDAKVKIATNLNSGLPRLNGIVTEVTLTINSETEDPSAVYFMKKISGRLSDKFGFYNIIQSNNNKIAKFVMIIDSGYSFADLKKFVTDEGYSVVEIKDCLVLKK